MSYTEILEKRVTDLEEKLRLYDEKFILKYTWKGYNQCLFFVGNCYVGTIVVMVHTKIQKANLHFPTDRAQCKYKKCVEHNCFKDALKNLLDELGLSHVRPLAKEEFGIFIDNKLFTEKCPIKEFEFPQDFI